MSTNERYKYASGIVRQWDRYFVHRTYIYSLVETGVYLLSFTLPDHGYGASASRGVPVYVTAFAGTYCAYPRRDGQAELTWVAGWLHTKMVYRLQTVTHPMYNVISRCCWTTT